MGLFYEDDLVSLITFSHGNISKGESKKEEVWELNRFCSKLNYNVVGGLSKLLKHFMRNYNWESIYSYADRRWTCILDNGYLKNGFLLEHITPPNYFYINLNKSLERKHRFNFRKNILKEMKSYDEKLSEKEIMLNEGYNYIYDCGHLKYILVK